MPRAGRLRRDPTIPVKAIKSTTQSFFHLWPYRNAEGCFYQYPQAQGFGGNLIAVFPNSMVGVRVAQNLFGGDDPYDSKAMGRLADFLVPFC